MFQFFTVLFTALSLVAEAASASELADEHLIPEGIAQRGFFQQRLDLLSRAKRRRLGGGGGHGDEHGDEDEEEGDPVMSFELEIERQGLSIHIVQLTDGSLEFEMTHNNHSLNITKEADGEASMASSEHELEAEHLESGFALDGNGTLEVLQNTAGSKKFNQTQHVETESPLVVRSWNRTVSTLNYTAGGVLLRTFIPGLAPKEEVKEYTHDYYGSDWPYQFPTCGNPQQSPINLMAPITSYGPSYQFYNFEEDELLAEYKDLELVEIEQVHASQTLEFVLSHEKGYQGFSSRLQKQLFNVPAKWDAVEVLIRHKSEHTISNRRFDLELQFVHGPNQKEFLAMERAEAAGESHRRLSEDDSEDELNALVAANHVEPEAAIVSILFDSQHYNTSLSEEDREVFYSFFDDMHLDDAHPKAEFLNLEALMSRIDWRNRWIYKGSMTLPPCSQFVIWHIPQVVYPIRPDQVASIREKLEKMGVRYNEEKGNIREIQVGLNREVYFIRSWATVFRASFIAVAAVALVI